MEESSATTPVVVGKAQPSPKKPEGRPRREGSSSTFKEFFSSSPKGSPRSSKGFFSSLTPKKSDVTRRESLASLPSFLDPETAQQNLRALNANMISSMSSLSSLTSSSLSSLTSSLQSMDDLLTGKLSLRQEYPTGIILAQVGTLKAKSLTQAHREGCTVKCTLQPYGEVSECPLPATQDAVPSPPMALRHSDALQAPSLLLEILGASSTSPIASALVDLRRLVAKREPKSEAQSIILTPIGGTNQKEAITMEVTFTFSPFSAAALVSPGQQLSAVLVDPFRQISKLSRKMSGILPEDPTKSLESYVDQENILTGEAKKFKRGTLNFKLKNVHICSNGCSATKGHVKTDIKDLEYVPNVRIYFEDGVVRRDGKRVDIAELSVEKTWDVRSINSCLDVEVYKKIDIDITNLASLDATFKGKKANVVTGALSLSIFEVIERDTERLIAFRPRDPVQGVDGLRSDVGYDWFELRLDDEVTGLVQISAAYHESFQTAIAPELHPDAHYVKEEWRNQFDPDIIKHQIKRMDKFVKPLILGAKELQNILQWRRPEVTIATWLGVITFILTFRGAHFLLVPVGGIFAMLTVNLLKRIFGFFGWEFIRSDDELDDSLYRPIAALRVMPIEAKNVIAADMDGLSDPYVKIFYDSKRREPHLIGRTASVKKSCSPVWGGAVRDTQSAIAMALSNKWLTDKFKNLGYEPDRSLQNVVVPWERTDGSGVVDVNAFRYPILQPITAPEQGDPQLVDWSNADGVVRFELYDEDEVGKDDFLGQVEVPLKSLVSDSTKGGKQKEIIGEYQIMDRPDKWYTDYARRHPLVAQMPRRLEKGDLGTLKLRLQLELRDPRAVVEAADKAASKALYEAIEYEEESTFISPSQLYFKIKNGMGEAQNLLCIAIDKLEKFKMIWKWTHPKKTIVVYLAILMGLLVVYNVPSRYLLAAWVTKKFFKKPLKLTDKDFERVMNLLGSLPNDEDLKAVFRTQHLRYVANKGSKIVATKMQADWAGTVWKRTDGLFGQWTEHYAVIRGRKMEMWKTMEDAKSGISCKRYWELARETEEASSLSPSDINGLRKDLFPFAVIDTATKQRSGRRRRLIAVGSDNDYKRVLELVKGSGGHGESKKTV